MGLIKNIGAFFHLGSRGAPKQGFHQSGDTVDTTGLPRYGEGIPGVSASPMPSYAPTDRGAFMQSSMARMTGMGNDGAGGDGPDGGQGFLPNIASYVGKHGDTISGLAGAAASAYGASRMGAAEDRRTEAEIAAQKAQDEREKMAMLLQFTSAMSPRVTY